MAKRPVQLDNRGYRKFGTRDMIAYAAGDVGLNMNLAMKGLAKIFWLAYMMLETGLLFTLLLVAQIWDVVNEPLIGVMIDCDQKRYKRGKFKQYAFIGAWGLLLSGCVLFLPLNPATAAVWLKASIFLVGYILWDAFFTFVSVPYGAMISQITVDIHERSQLSAWRAAGAVVGTLLPNALLPALIFKKVQDGVIPDNLQAVGCVAYIFGDLPLGSFVCDERRIFMGERGLTTALIMGVLSLIALLFMLKRVTIRVDAPMTLDKSDREKFHGLKAFGRFMRNRPAVGATVAAMGVCFGMGAAVIANAAVFATYFDKLKWFVPVQLVCYVPVVVMVPFAPKIVDRFGKKEVSVIGALISFVGAGVMLAFPAVSKDLALTVYLLGLGLFSIGMGIYVCVSWAMMGDAIDYNEWKFSTREETSVFAIFSFFKKLAQCAGYVVVMLPMGVMSFVCNPHDLSQTFADAHDMCWLVAGLHMVSALLLLVGLALVYNLDKKKLELMNSELASRRR